MMNIITTPVLLRFALLAASGAFFRLGELTFSAARAFMPDDTKRSRHIRNNCPGVSTDIQGPTSVSST
jgi:hypothetical protein